MVRFVSNIYIVMDLKRWVKLKRTIGPETCLPNIFLTNLNHDLMTTHRVWPSSGLQN